MSGAGGFAEDVGASNRDPPRFFAVTTGYALSYGLLLTSLAGSIALAGCTRDPDRSGVKAGAIEITRDACGSCHEISGIEEANGRVGPSLRHFASRKMIAGRLPNTPANLELWLKSPQRIKPGSAMPDQGLSDQQVHDVALYLLRMK